jgi:NAD(P) transhydrogenase subunit alpha
MCYNVHMVLKIGILKEISNYELRVAITPEVVERALKLSGNSVAFVVEKGAGEAAYFSDQHYESAGATIAAEKEVLQSDVLLFVTNEKATAVASLRGGVKPGAVAIGLFNSLSDTKVVDAFKKLKVQVLDMNLLPRQLSMAQSMDAMTSQASVAGYNAVLLAAQNFPSFLPMLTTAAGTIKPASVLVLGAGIAGLQAIGTAKRLGAVVTAFDVRLAAEEEVKSLGAKFLDLSKYGAADVAAKLRAGQGEGGYARALTAEELNAQKTATDQALADFDIVITTASVPGKVPPQFISTTGLQNMKPGSVVVDLAASALGGNVEGSKPEQIVAVNDVKVIGAPSLASASPAAASALLGRNFIDVVLHFLDSNGNFVVNVDDELAVLDVTTPKEVVNATEDIKPIESEVL